MGRLEVINSLIKPCGVFADIGCDHGFTAKYILDNSLAKTVYASDISLNSLSKAIALLKPYKNCVCVVSDGLKGLPSIPDSIVISGLGGREIINIISGYRIKRLILQPQNFIKEVRRYLAVSGYKIITDLVVSERGKFYDIIEAESDNSFDGISFEIDEIQAEWGVFYKQKSEELKKKLSFYEKKLRSYKQTAENSERLRILTEVKKWQM